jgi:hypothetical protein
LLKISRENHGVVHLNITKIEHLAPLKMSNLPARKMLLGYLKKRKSY